MQACERFKIPVKLLFFKEVPKILTKFLVVFQTGKPMASVLVETLEDLIKTLTGKLIRKDLRDKSCSEITKLDFNNVNNQKPTHLVYLGFAVNHGIQLLKSSKKITDSQILKFKKEAVKFLATLCSHLMKKNPVKSFFARCLESVLSLLRNCLIKFCLRRYLTRLFLLVLPTALSHSTASLLLLLLKRIKQNF